MEQLLEWISGQSPFTTNVGSSPVATHLKCYVFRTTPMPGFSSVKWKCLSVLSFPINLVVIVKQKHCWNGDQYRKTLHITRNRFQCVYIFALSLCVSCAYLLSKCVYKKESLEQSTYIVNFYTLFDLLSTTYVLIIYICLFASCYLTPRSTIFQLYLPTCRKSLTNFIT